MLGERIKQARRNAGYSLRDLADRVGVSAMAISKYERNASTPSSEVLIALAGVLDVRVEYFFRDIGVELTEVEYRKRSDLPEKARRRILADVRDQVERWLALEEFVPTPWSRVFDLPDALPERVVSLDEIEEVATTLRREWDLGLNPLPDLIDTLEARGLKVFITEHDADWKFDGLAAQANGMPVVVVGEAWPGDRQRFTLTHELGHLVLAGRLAPELDEEKACHRFAGAFLVPSERVFSALGMRRSWLEPQELMLLKQEWGLSMGGWSYRAQDLGILPKARMRELWRFFRDHGWNTREPDPQYPKETTRVFAQLVYRAVAEERIGEAKAAELLGLSVVEFHACRNMECAGDAGCQ